MIIEGTESDEGYYQLKSLNNECKDDCKVLTLDSENQPKVEDKSDDKKGWYNSLCVI